MKERCSKRTFIMPTALTTATNLYLSDLAPNTTQSEIRAMTVACAAVDGINLAQGVCDTDPPHPVVEAAITAIRSGHNIYTRLDGIAPLRAAIAEKFATFNGITVDPDREVLVTSGATGALQAALLALLNPGDECLVLEPFYGYHVSTLRSQRVVPVIVPLEAPDWVLDLDRLSAVVTPRTRAIILNSPSNPSGKVFSQPELELLADFAIKHDLFVFTDEMYEYFIYDGARHSSIAAPSRSLGSPKPSRSPGGDSGILQPMHAGCRLLDTSTISPTYAPPRPCNMVQPQDCWHCQVRSTKSSRLNTSPNAMTFVLR